MTTVSSNSFSITVNSIQSSMPDWNDENAAYASQGLSIIGAQLDINQEPTNSLNAFTGLSDIPNTHNDTEGDPLWHAYNMYRRLNGIRQSAANSWLTRSTNLAGFFRDSYVGGSAYNQDADFNFDHIYGWGLCDWAEEQGDSQAITTINSLLANMSAHFADGSSTSVNPGDDIFGPGISAGRRWARQCMLAVRAQEVSPNALNKAWRDKVIDIMLQVPSWNSTYGFHEAGPAPTDSPNGFGSGAYASGIRFCQTYHTGIWMTGLWWAWLALTKEADPRVNAIQQRILDLARFYRDFGLENGLLHVLLGYNISTGEQVRGGSVGSPNGVYTIPPINGLVFAYKLSGDQSYLNAAWTYWKAWQEKLVGSPGIIHHFVDSDISGATGSQFLAYNKGELQYVYALFENAGSPTLV